MNRKQKKITIFTLSVFIVIAAVVITIRYVPLNKIMRIGSTSETEFINQTQIRSKSPNALYYDFEVDPKSGNTNGLYKGIAHSGRFSAKAFGKNSFSIAINRTAGEIGMDNLDAVAMSTWLYIFPTSSEILGAFVFTANNAIGVNICWKGINVSGKDVPMGKWFKINGLFNLSDLKLEQNSKIQIYFWNNSSCDMLVDDFYIVFGGQKQRRGDSAYVDMTRGNGFQPRFNFPPYPVNWLEKQEINNQNSTFLIKSVDRTEGEISPLDKICKGKFTGDPDGKDDLLVVKPAGTVELYHFCTDKTKFVNIKTAIPSDLASSLKAGKIMAGRFTGTGNDQLLVITKEELILAVIDPMINACSSVKDDQGVFKVILKEPLQKWKEMGSLTGSEFLSADFDGDKIPEVIIIGIDGSWTLFKLSPSRMDPLRVMASGKENSVQEWQSKNQTFTVSIGRFLNAYARDLILTIFKSANSMSCSYSLRMYDPGKRRFIPLFPERQQYTGKTIGMDTLSPGDKFFTGLFDNSGRTRILRYNRRWRFDLKEIKFNDTTFRVVANMDFTGYEKDFNPKYYEVLQIIPGNFLKPGTGSFLVIGRNCETKDTITNGCTEFKNLPFLPNTLQFYSFQDLKK